MAQALHLINGEGVNKKISSDKGLVATLLKANKQDRDIVEELYLTCFGRLPTKPEMDAAIQTVADAMKPPAPAAKVPEAKAEEAKKDEAKKEEAKREEPKFDPAVARRQVFEDLLWALINGKEFVFNH